MIWGQLPEQNLDLHSLVLGRRGGNPLTPSEPTNTHPNETTQEATRQKLSTCKHVFVTAKGFRIATFGHLWPQIPRLCSFPKVSKLKNSLWQKHYVGKQKDLIFEKLNSLLDVESSG